MIQRYILFLSLFASTLFGETLTLHEAVQKAIETHPDIKEFALGVKKSQSAIDVARADYLPQVNLSAEYDPTKTYVFPANGVFNTKDDDGYQIGASLKQKIWDFSKTTNQIDAQKEGVDISKLTLSDAKALLAYKVKLQYELMVVQRKAVVVREKDLEAKRALYEQANAFVKHGLKTSADATRFLSAYYFAKDNLAISQASFEKARTRLSLYIGQEVSEDVTLQEGFADAGIHRDTQSILASSPLLKALKIGVEKSALEYKSIEATHYGSIDAVASYLHQNTLNKYDATVVGVTLNVPLYTGGRTSAYVEQALLNKEISEATLRSKSLALKEEVAALLIDIERYANTIEAKKAQLQAATSTSNLLEARYKEGLATYIEVLDAIALRLDAELGLLSAKYERSSAIHRLEYLEGKVE